MRGEAQLSVATRCKADSTFEQAESATMDWETVTNRDSAALEAIGTEPPPVVEIEQDRCTTCGKRILRQLEVTGITPMWKHRSTLAAVSYTPDPHNATSSYQAEPHEHEWADPVDGRHRCAVEHCGAQVRAIPADEQRVRHSFNGTDRRGQENYDMSRLRGAAKGSVYARRNAEAAAKKKSEIAG